MIHQCVLAALVLIGIIGGDLFLNDQQPIIERIHYMTLEETKNPTGLVPAGFLKSVGSYQPSGFPLEERAWFLPGRRTS